MSEQRSVVFSIMKAIAIIMVVAGHLGIAVIEDYVNQFHLALFYFVAGYFFKEEYIDKKREYVLKKIKTLYLPFIKYALFFLCIHNILVHVSIYPQEIFYPATRFATAAFDAIFLITSYEPLLGAMWFLQQLLLVSLLYLFISFFCSKIFTKHLLLIKGGGILLLAIIGFILDKRGTINPWCIWNALQILTIFYSGRLFAANASKIKPSATLAVLALLFIAFLTSEHIYVRYQMNLMQENELILFLIMPLLGCYAVYSLSCKMASLRIGKMLSWIGENTFEIMALHFLSFKLIILFQCWIYDLDMSNLSVFPTLPEKRLLWAVPYLIAGIMLPILFKITYTKVRLFPILKYARNNNSIL